MRKHLPFMASLIFLALFVQLVPGQEPTSQEPIDYQDSQNEEDDVGEARVARLSFIEGDVSFLREGDTEWAEAVINLPLLAGDQIYCGAGARAEIQLGR